MNMNQNEPYDNNRPYGQNQQSYSNQPYGQNQQPYSNQPYGQNQPYNRQPYGNPYQAAGTAFPDARTRVQNILVKSFLYMFIALLITGITSLITAQNFLYLYLSMVSSGSTAPLLIFIIADLVVAFAASASIRKNNAVLSGVLFFLYAVLNGIMFSSIFLTYSATDISRVFFMTAVIFGVMAAVGNFTRINLDSAGHILMFGLIGIIVASLINLFLRSSGLDYLITIIGIGIFMAFAAYDVKKIKAVAASNTFLSENVIGFYGAMELYLDFLNLFLRLLQIFGGGRRSN